MILPKPIAGLVGEAALLLRAARRELVSRRRDRERLHGSLIAALPTLMLALDRAMGTRAGPIPESEASAIESFVATVDGDQAAKIFELLRPEQTILLMGIVEQVQKRQEEREKNNEQ